MPVFMTFTLAERRLGPPLGPTQTVFELLPGVGLTPPPASLPTLVADSCYA